MLLGRWPKTTPVRRLPDAVNQRPASSQAPENKSETLWRRPLQATDLKAIGAISPIVRSSCQAVPCAYRDARRHATSPCCSGSPPASRHLDSRHRRRRPMPPCGRQCQVAVVCQRAKPKPFKNLTFSEALRRALDRTQPKGELNKQTPPVPSADELLAELDAMNSEELDRLPNYKVRRRQRVPRPRPDNWLSGIPGLRSVPNLGLWRDNCAHLGIEVAGDTRHAED